MHNKQWAAILVVIGALAPGAAAQPAITVLENFNGIHADGIAPPDTTGAAGATQFVQWVNLRFAVYDKATGKLLKGPLRGNSLWKGTNGPCQTNNSGQPMVEWDKLAQRWVLAQFALTDPPFYCMAVSTTPDATGDYFLYEFPFDAGSNPSSPRLAVWPDAYYASFNVQPSGKRAAPLVVAYDRTNMLAGLNARGPIRFHPSALTNLLPADFDGSQPPVPGEPEYYAGLGGANILNLYQFHVDFTSPNNSFFKLLTQVGIQSAGLGCSRNPPQWKNGTISQPASANGVKLDALPDQLMYRLAWRNLGGTEHLLSNQTVILSDAPVVAGVTWYDVAIPPAGGPMLVQQGTVSNPALSYWIGSLAEDQAGDIALGFNASGANLYPSIEVTGHLATDPPGTMSTPAFLAQGGGPQINTSKWGSHADMTVDPTDDCVFWFTGEYVAVPRPHAFDWSTQISSFRFNACQ
jgi:hypothetical protein